MKMLEISPDLSIILGPGMVLKRAGEKCALYTAGQSSEYSGFVIDDEYESVLEQINEALSEEE
jgi:hypothetical protein